MSFQRFKCHGCELVFSPPDDYDDDPKTRTCPECGHHPIGYLGYFGSLPYVRSDSLGGVHGVQSMADGKQYDSKSAYYDSLRAKGLSVQEAGMSPNKPKTENIDWKSAVAESLQQLKTSPTKKGKKK